MAPVTVAELTERYRRREVNNREFCSLLNGLYWKRMNESELDTLLKFLIESIQQKRITEPEIRKLIGSLGMKTNK